MTQPHTFKSIFLERLNRFINPNFSHKYIWALFLAGTGLIGYQRVIQLGGSLEIITDEVKLKLSVPTGVDTVFVIAGVILILVSGLLFYLLVIKGEKKSKKYKSLKKAAPDLRKLLDENRRVFLTFGPNSDAGNVEDVRWDMQVWENTKQNNILPNNNQILSIINNVSNLTNEEERIAGDMRSHIEAFKTHCSDPLFDYSEHQFPMAFADLINQYCSNNQHTRATEYGAWVKQKVTAKSISIEKMYLYGGALYSQKTSDIDVLVKVETTAVDDIKVQALVWKDISRDFREAFGLKLHLTVFTGLEVQNYNQFLSKIPSHLEIN